MEGHRRVLAWLDCVASLLAAGFITALVVGQSGSEHSGPAETLALSRPLFVTLAVIFALALFAFAVRRFYHQVFKTRRGRYLYFDTPEGKVRIRTSSVEQVINRAVRCMDEVADARATLVFPKASRVPARVRVRCRLFDRPNILAIQDQIRALVCDRYLEMFPTEDPLPVEVGIEGITFETPGPTLPPKPHPKRTKKSSDEEAEEAHPFRAQYPVGD